MKKSIFLLAGILGLSLVSCDDSSDLGKPQVNTPPTVVEANGVKVVPETTICTAVDLNPVANMNLEVMSATLQADLPKTAGVTGVLQVAELPDFTNAVDIDIFNDPETVTVAEDGIRTMPLYVEANLLNDAFQSFYKKNPAARDLYMQYQVVLRDGDQVTELMTGWSNPQKVSVTPIDAKYDIEAAYYVFGKYVGNNQVANAEPMLHGEGHVYDNPVFSYFFQVDEAQAEAGFTLYVAPASVVDANGSIDQCFGASPYIPGSLAKGVNPITVNEIGSYKLEVNMLTDTYEVLPAPAELWVSVGKGFGAKAHQLHTSDLQTYFGFAYLSGGTFMLTSANDFKHQQWGGNGPAVNDNGTAKGNLKANASFPGDMALLPGYEEGGDAALKKVFANGLYYMSANIVDLAYRATPVKLGVVGTPNNWGNADADGVKTPDIVMTADKNFIVYTAEVTFAEAGEWKIRANNDWTVNVGGAAENLQEGNAAFGGENFKVTEPGTYTITIDTNTFPMQVTCTKK